MENDIVDVSASISQRIRYLKVAQVTIVSNRYVALSKTTQKTAAIARK